MALKVMPQGKLHLLEREVEALQGFEHKNVVRLMGSGRLDDSRVYLAMEFVDGSLMRHYCQAATRPSEVLLLSWAWSLLDALVTLHPRESEIRRLRSSSEAGADLQALLEARYGYIHRDIKPENVIIAPNRGPILIDFNISVRVSTPIQTLTATPGYLPRSMTTMWSPRVDLFQLGLTLLQVASGETLLEGNRGDLILILRSAVSIDTAAFIERLLREDRSGYQTAYIARRDVQRLRDKL